MKILAIGDLHLSFGQGVEKPMDIFGELWQDHAERLKEQWLASVKPEDVVIICGDLSWGLKLAEAEADFEWLRALPGRKAVFKGNHDLWWQSAGKLNRLYGDENLVFVQNTAFITCTGEKKIAICGTRGWLCPGEDMFSEADRKIYERELGRLRLSLAEGKAAGADEIIGVLHFPPTNDKLERSGFTQLMSEYGVRTCVYGHLHGEEAFKKGLRGIYDNVRYELVSLDYLRGCPKEVKL